MQKKNDKTLRLVEKNIGEIKFIIAEISSPNYKVKFARQLYFKVLNMLAKGLLKNKGAEIIINEKSGADSGEVQIPLTVEYMKICASATAKHMEFTNDTVYLCDKNMAFVDYELLVDVCLKTKNLCIITDNHGKAENLCEELYRNYGIYPDIYDNGHRIPYRFKTVIDFDKRHIKLNSDIIVDGVILKFNIHGLNLDFSYLMGVYPEIIRYASFKSWTSGKNQLTIGLC